MEPPQTNNIIGLAGKRGSGKSTIASYLVLYKGYVKLSFADPLKRLVTDVFDLDKDACYNIHKKDTILQDWNVAPRDLMKKIGTEMFRDTLPELLPELRFPKGHIWTSNMYLRIQNLRKENPGVKIVIDDCRFEDEYNLIQNMGGKVIKIMRQSLSDIVDTHRSESDDVPYDMILYNNDTLYTLYKNICELLIQINKPEMANIHGNYIDNYI